MRTVSPSSRAHSVRLSRHGHVIGRGGSSPDVGLPTHVTGAMDRRQSESTWCGFGLPRRTAASPSHGRANALPAPAGLSRADGRLFGAARGPRSRRRSSVHSLRSAAVHARTSAAGRDVADRPTRVHRPSPRLRTASGRWVGHSSTRWAHPGTHPQSTSRLRGSRSSGWRSDTRRRRRHVPAYRHKEARP